MPRARNQKPSAPTEPPMAPPAEAPAPARASTPGEEACGATGSKSRAFKLSLLAGLLDAAGIPADAAPEIRERQVGATMAAMRGFAPRDEVEGLLASAAVALHGAGMGALRRATRGELPIEMASKLRRDGAAMISAMAGMVDAIETRRGRTVSQRVTVEHVNVGQGGQAIIGAIASGTPLRGEGG